MSKVRKWDGEGTFAGTRDNDVDAPKPVIDSSPRGLLKCIRSGHDQRVLQPADGSCRMGG
jgi:hypothetical protein